MDSGTQDQIAQDRQEKSTRGKRVSRAGKILIFAGLFGLAGMWAGLYGNLGHTYWIFAAALNVVASFCLAMGSRLELRNHHCLKWQYNGVAWVIVLAGLSLGAFVLRAALRTEVQAVTNSRLVVIPAVVLLKTIPVEPLAFREKNENITLVIGGNRLVLPPVPPGKTARKDIGRQWGAGTHEQPSRILMIATEKQVFFNIEFAPLFGMPALKLENNELSHLPPDWDCNHSPEAIEIVNEKLIPILQIHYRNDAEIVFTGVLTYTNGAVFASEKNYELMNNAPMGKDEFFGRIEALRLKRLFKYPAWKHRGEFDPSL